MFEILSTHQELIARFGDHHTTVDMTINVRNIELLAEGLNKWIKELPKTTSLNPVKQVDVLLTESNMAVKNIRSMNCLRPFGTDFSKLILEMDDLSISSVKAMDQQKSYPKLTLDENNTVALFWQNGHSEPELRDEQPINILESVQISGWDGSQSSQIVTQDIAVSEQQISDHRDK